MADTAEAVTDAVEPTNDAVVATETEIEETVAPNEEQQDQPVKKKKKIIVRKKKRPARVQADPALVKKDPSVQSGQQWNIWYGKFEGGQRGDEQHSLNKPAPGRCNIARDSGWTQADKVVGSYFCLHFARGVCHQGSACQYLHRLPGIHDLFQPNVDCFGREKHSDYRDDMGGTGSFQRQNRVLYCGRIHVQDGIEEVVSRHFAEWGQVERIRVLTGRGVAFITYTNEANAQFAKEAMHQQALDHEEILNVRWATADPNPMAQKREARRLEEQAAESIRAALPADFIAEIEGRDPEARKRKKIEGSFGLSGYDAPDDVWHARTRQLEAPESAAGSGQGQLGAPEQPQMIEAGQPEPQRPNPIMQFLSEADIARIQQSFAARNAQAAPKSPGGPLVSYESSDDESN